MTRRSLEAMGLREGQFVHRVEDGRRPEAPSELDDYDWADDSRRCYDLWMGINRSALEWRCVFCGRQDGHMEQHNGHYQMTCCKQVMEGCCAGEST